MSVVLALLLVGSLGCRNLNWRGQNADAEGMKFNATETKTKYISSVAGPWGINFAKVQGPALVTQLDNTGDDPPNLGPRQMVLKDMHAHYVQNANEILRSKTTSIALVTGYLPPGTRKGDRFDVEVRMYPESGTSLRGGYVMQTGLRPWALFEGKAMSNHEVGSAKGRILVDALFADGKDADNEKHGVILGGAVATEDRHFGLTIQEEFGSVKTARAISRAINSRFTAYDGGQKQGIADPKTDRKIEFVLLPVEYRRNVGRFVQVVMNLAYGESLEEQSNRIEQLEVDLSNPELCEAAALRLEAIGKKAIPVLRRGLRDPNKEVRFHAAQALTYLDQTDGIPELKLAAMHEPLFRWHALTALASSSNIEAGIALADLLHADGAETRYGAFHALKIRSANDPLVAPDPVSKDFFLNIVPTTGASMVHFARQHRPEIVIFGGNEPVESNFLYVKHGLTVRVNAAELIEITRFADQQGEVKVTCPNTTTALLRTLTQTGCDYGTIFDLCAEAKKNRTLNVRVEVNRLPSSLRARFSQLEEEVATEQEESDPDSLPTMFGGPDDKSADERSMDEINTSEDQPKSFFDKLKASMQGE